ncbi:hypothetical protein ASG89_07345 [Paenibacillus sp. Soil766]|uniref:hypothetical protein n=1 Tax=Paenibacillus sp. Soil766 TaxID=1736404 RepID=UPI00070F7D6F|nr:hypothetical protein [Paenibacillus sp. Soil766]KRE93304.1 hypothetical protein ASG89_07345 [Paenibacillus sp. Soil766]
MNPLTRKCCWTIMVWLILGLFVFPLTPPISNHAAADTDVLISANTTQVLTSQQQSPNKEFIHVYENKIQLHDQFHKHYEMTVFVVFIVFLTHLIWKKLKVILLAFLKFTSRYTGLIPSYS